MLALQISASTVRPFTSVRPRGPRAVRPVVAPLRAEKEFQTPSDTAEARKSETVLPFLRDWPPKPFTEHGEPKPEDDPKNFDGGERVKGPSAEEVNEKRAKAREDSPFSNPSREGGTQMGGGGEGSSA